MKSFYRILSILIISFFYSDFAKAQTNPLVVTLTNDLLNLSVCSGTSTFTVEIVNPSPYNIDNGSVVVALPPGVVYDLGSMSGAGVVDTNTVNGDLQNPTFTFNQIPMVSTGGIDGTLSFTIEIKANCDVRDFLEGGGVLTNDVVISGTSDNLSSQNPNFSQTRTSTLYNVELPTLAVTNISPSTFTANIGDNFTRCITITNSGEGPLTEFFVFDKRNPSSIVLNSVTYGPDAANQTGTVNQTTLANGDSLYFSGIDFTAIGDGDNLFEENEVIVICENVQVNGCVGAQTELIYWWDCNADTCQVGYESANINFPGEAPNIVSTFTSDWDVNNMNGNCYGDTDPNAWSSSITLENNSTSDAYNVQLDIFQGRTGYYSNYWSSFNMSSFTIQVNSGAPVPILLGDFDLTQTTDSKDCLPVNPIGRVLYTIPFIAAGDIVTISWGRHTCCISEYCNETGPVDRLLTWSYRGAYENRCGEDREILRRSLDWYYNQSTISLDNSPGTLLSTSSGPAATGTISLLTDPVRYGLPRDVANSKSRFQIVLPKCLQYESGTFRIINQLGASILPDSIGFNPANDTINFYYDSINGGNGHVLGNKYNIDFDVSLDCSSCNSVDQGKQEVLFNGFYSPNKACNCEVPFGCEVIELELLCPPVCEGANLMNTVALRKNLGLSDNDDNGIADLAPIVMDTSLVKRNRYMFGDTMLIKQEVYVQNSNSLNWSHAFSSVTISEDDGSLQYANSIFMLFDASQGSNGMWYTCPKTVFIPTTEVLGADSVKHTIDFDINSLISTGCLPSGFQFQTGDSLYIKHEFVMAKNASPYSLHPGNLINVASLSSIPYSSTIADSDLFGCNEISKPFLLIEYYWRTYGPPSNQYSTADCDAFQVSQDYYLSIGPPHSNYGGGNIFPFEFRYWGYPDTLSIIMPIGYEYLNGSAEFRHIATTGTHPSSPHTIYGYFPLDSVNSINNPLNKFSFDVGSYFRDSTSINIGDDGFQGTLRASFVPGCDVETNVSESIGYEWKFDQVTQLTPGLPPSISNSTHDEVVYFGPELFFQVDNPVKSTPNGLNKWVVDVSNTSGISDAPNFWIGANNTTITIDSLLNNVTGLMQYPNSGGIFDLDTIETNEAENYFLYTTLTQCSRDSIPLLYGWGCSLTPDSLQNYECIPDTLWLHANPLFPQISNDITVLTNDTTPLCDVTTYQVDISNILLGNAFNIVSTLSLPSGMLIDPGTCQIVFDGVTSPLADPSYVGSTDYSWDFDTVYPIIDSGLAGISNTSLNNFQIQFDVTTNCNYNSGSQVEVQTYGESFCGDPDLAFPEFSEELHINGVEPPYLTSVELNSQYIMPCGNTTIEVLVIVDAIVNSFGANGTIPGDSITLYFPEGVTYSSGSFTPYTLPLYAPNPASFSSQIIANEQQISWELPQGIMPGDTIGFTIDIDADASFFECGTTLIKGEATSSAQTLCISSGQNCSIGVTTGNLIDAIYVYKGDFVLSDSTATSVLNAPSGETVSVGFDILNIGGDIFAGFNTQVDFYSDLDGDSIFDPLTDSLLISDIITDSILGGTANIYSYNGSIDIPSTDVCGFLVAIQPSSGTCLCDPVWFYISADLQQPDDLLDMCYGEPIVIGTDSVNNYTYSWQNPPLGALNSQNIAKPTLTYLNTNLTSQELVFIRDVDRGGCFASDTTRVTTYPAPLVDCGADVRVVLDNNCEFSVPDYTAKANISDACPAGTGVTIVQSPIPGTILAGVDQVAVSLYVISNVLGDTIDSCSFALILEDQSSPTITTCINTSIVNADANCMFVVPDYGVQLGIGLDNCDSANYTITQTPAVGTEIISTEGAVETLVVEVTDGSGNTSTCTILLTIACADVAVYEYVTPDANGQNDFLLIPGVHRFPGNTLQIFNRWGTEVFSVTDYKNDWDGTYNGKTLPSGTYYYILKLSSDREPLTGYLELNRN